MKSENKLTKNCECCYAAYAAGKNYGDDWCQEPILDKSENGELIIRKPQGLCEFCNPNSKWFVNKKCHEIVCK